MANFVWMKLTAVCLLFIITFGKREIKIKSSNLKSKVFAEEWQRNEGFGYIPKGFFYSIGYSTNAKKIKGSVRCQSKCNVYVLDTENFTNV